MTSDAQQSRDGQLKLAFQKHLPQRIRSIQRRIRALHADGWDINTLLLIYNEVQQLAGSSGNYGIVDASERLYSLEVFLAVLMRSGQVPDQQQTEEVLALVDGLDSLGAPTEDEPGDDLAPPQRSRVSNRHSAELQLPEPVIELTGLPSLVNVPNFIEPPPGFLPFKAHVSSPDVVVQDGAGHAVEVDRLEAAPAEITLGNLADKLVSGEAQYAIETDDDLSESWQDGINLSLKTSAEIAAAPAPAAQENPPGVSQLTVYLLCTPGADSDALQARLEGDYQLHCFDQMDEFKEVLSALGPDVVMLQGDFVGQIESLSPIINKIRSKQSGPMPVLAFCDDDDVGKRIKMLRAGADALLHGDASAAAIKRRLQELLQTAVADPYRVLIVEDDRSQALFAEAILRKAGMAVRLERDPYRVMEALEAFRPDLILMDLYMPDCDGMELTAIIREREDFINTPIVFLSGENDVDKHFDALLAGGDDFLAKPIRPRHLIQAVTNRVRRARAMVKRLQQRPSQDTVTGLSDRPYWLEQVNRYLAVLDQAAAVGGVLYVEVDQAFELRQRVGLTGFESLVDQLAPILTAKMSAHDLAARYGDSAYCLLLPQAALPHMQQFAQTLSDQVATFDFELDGAQRTRLTVSIGICPMSKQWADAGAVIANAERACNLGHGDALSRVNTFGQGPLKAGDAPSADDGNEALSQLIESCLVNNRLQVLYQPIVSLQGDRTEQYQALLRLPGTDGKPVTAAHFIPVAEQCGLLAQVDHWIINKALSVIDERQRHRRPLRLFVNQSLSSLMTDARIERLAKSMQTRSIDAKLLVIELKLPEIIEDIEAAIACSEALQDIGVALSLGAFDGTQRAFEALELLQVNYVKLEQITDSGGGAELAGGHVTDVVAGLHQREQLVIVPAIENARTAARLWPTGVDYIQGNFVQRPEADLIYRFSDAHV